MTTGTGLALLGIWGACATTWHSARVGSSGAILMTAIATVLTVVLL